MANIVQKYGVKVCLEKDFGHDHVSAAQHLRRHAGDSAIIALIDGSVHMTTNPSSFQVWFDTMEELNDFLKSVGEEEKQKR